MLRAPENQFILWRMKGGTKVPCDPKTGRVASALDPGIWTSELGAAEAVMKHDDEYGIGFVITANDPYFFLDLDACALPDRTGWLPHVDEVLECLPGAAIEISQSGTGLHVIAKGKAPPHRTRCRDIHAELYTADRFCAFSRYGWKGNSQVDLTPGLNTIVERWFPPPPPAAAPLPDMAPTGEAIQDDEELIRQAKGSLSLAATFGDSVSFSQLWDADAEALGRKWPSPGRAYDASAADAALAQHLAYWTGRDAHRIQRLMRRSKLAREKWDKRADYLQRTIAAACARQENVREARNSPTVPHGLPIMPPETQAEYFRGCVYVRSKHMVWTASTGELLAPQVFKCQMAGHTFQLDQEGKKTTRNAFDAFIDSQVNRAPRVSAVAFEVNTPPGEIVNGGHRVNTFAPRWGRREPGDVSIWIDHLRRLVPDDNDRRTLESYLAACVQQAGEKFQFCIVMQGVQGNGKTVLYHALEYALGPVYCHQLDPKDIDSKFNAWIERKLLVCVEEIHTAGRFETADALKPLVTNRRVPLQPKGVDQSTGDNVANFLLFSNHRDAVLKTRDDRRYCVIYTAQQNAEDLATSGMDSAYFRRLYGWLYSDQGSAAVADWLWTRPVEIDTMGRAPHTSSTDLAIVESLGTAEQILREEIELEAPGFQNDLICLDVAIATLSNFGKRLSPQRAAGVLEALGFVRHPLLPQGRLRVGDRRVRLYVKKGTPAEGEGRVDMLRGMLEGITPPSPGGGDELSDY